MKNQKTDEFTILCRIEKILRWESNPKTALQKIAYTLKKYMQETGECLDFILDPTPGTDEEAERTKKQKINYFQDFPNPYVG